MATIISAPKNYSVIQKTLHWLVALIIIAQLVLGEYMADAWDAFERSGDLSGFSSPVVLLHVWGGLSIVAFAVWRLALRKTQGVPEEPKDEPAILKLAASAAHIALYALMFIAPLSGAFTYFGEVELAAEVHEIMKPLLIVLVLAHACGALYQHFWLKTDVLKRMTHG